MTGKDKGKQGSVSLIFQERNWVHVVGLNTKIHTIMKTKDFPGVNVLREKPLLINEEVALVDPSDLYDLNYLIFLLIYFFYLLLRLFSFFNSIYF